MESYPAATGGRSRAFAYCGGREPPGGAGRPSEAEGAAEGEHAWPSALAEQKAALLPLIHLLPSPCAAHPPTLHRRHKADHIPGVALDTVTPTDAEGDEDDEERGCKKRRNGGVRIFRMDCRCGLSVRVRSRFLL